MLRLNATYSTRAELRWLMERLGQQSIAKLSNEIPAINDRFRVYIDLKTPLTNEQNTQDPL